MGGWKSRSIHDEGEYLVTYTVARGVWTGTKENRRFVAHGTVENKMIKVTAKDFNHAKKIAFTQLTEHRALNEFIKVLRAVHIPKKEEKDVV